METVNLMQHHASTNVNVAGVRECVSVNSSAVVLGHTAVLLQMSSKMVRLFQVHFCHLTPLSFL